MSAARATRATACGPTRRALFAGVAALACCRALARESPTLRVVTWNIRHGQGTDGRLDLARVAATLASLRPDVVLLQEVDRGCARSGGVDQARALGEGLGLAHAFAAHRPFDGGEYGLAVLARGRVEAATALPLEAAPRPLIALEAVLVLEAGPRVAALCVHLVDTLAERTAEAAAVRAAAETRAPGLPVFVGGDFNGARDTAPLAAFGGWQLADPAAPTFPADAPVREIDFLLASRGAWREAAVTPEPLAADHRPVLGVWAAPA